MKSHSLSPSQCHTLKQAKILGSSSPHLKSCLAHQETSLKAPKAKISENKCCVRKAHEMHFAELGLFSGLTTE